MNTMINFEELILNLIKNDLINSKLVNHLNDIGLKADEYYLSLTDLIYDLMGLEGKMSEDEFFEFYSPFTNRMKRVDLVKDWEQVKGIATEIHNGLASIK